MKKETHEEMKQHELPFEVQTLMNESKSTAHRNLPSIRKTLILVYLLNGMHENALV